MKAKILSPEEAEELGLKRASAIIGQSVVMAGKTKEDPGKIVEKQIMRENGEKELVFMAEERKAYFKKKGNFEEYIGQFKKIPRGIK